MLLNAHTMLVSELENIELGDFAKICEVLPDSLDRVIISLQKFNCVFKECMLDIVIKF